jgi:hypothetical protein
MKFLAFLLVTFAPCLVFGQDFFADSDLDESSSSHLFLSTSNPNDSFESVLSKTLKQKVSSVADTLDDQEQVGKVDAAIQSMVPEWSKSFQQRLISFAGQLEKEHGITLEEIKKSTKLKKQVISQVKKLWGLTVRASYPKVERQLLTGSTGLKRAQNELMKRQGVGEFIQEVFQALFFFSIALPGYILFSFFAWVSCKIRYGFDVYAVRSCIGGLH